MTHSHDICDKTDSYTFDTNHSYVWHDSLICVTCLLHICDMTVGLKDWFSLFQSCIVLQYATVCCSVLQWVGVCCSALQCVAVCCSTVSSISNTQGPLAHQSRRCGTAQGLLSSADIALYIGLFCRYLGLFDGFAGLLCRFIGLFCGYIGLFCRYIQLFCMQVGSFGLTGLWCILFWIKRGTAEVHTFVGMQKESYIHVFEGFLQQETWSLLVQKIRADTL